MPLEIISTLCTECRPPRAAASTPCIARAGSTACPPLIVLAVLASQQAVPTSSLHGTKHHNGAHGACRGA
jgi:hypothetical protein